MTQALPNRIAGALSTAARFVLRQRLESGGYRLQGEAAPTTLSTAIGAIAHFFLTGKPDLSALDYLLATRDATGAFTDPLLSHETVDSALHPFDYLFDQTNYFAVRALRLCRRSVDPGPLANSPVGRVRKWVEELNWADPWLESNRVMFALELLEPRHEGAKAELLDWLAAHSDPQTGYWGTDRGATALRGMAGAYHFYGFLLAARISLPDASTVIRSTLSLQEADGLFTPGGGGNSCLDMDAVDILALYEPALPRVERTAVRTGALAAAEAILAMQSSSGGFPESSSPEARSRTVALAGADSHRITQTWRGERLIRYSSWRQMEYDATAPDLWSTLCRAVALARIAQILALPRVPVSLGAGICQMLRAEEVES